MDVEARQYQTSLDVKVLGYIIGQDKDIERRWNDDNGIFQEAGLPKLQSGLQRIWNFGVSDFPICFCETADALGLSPAEGRFCLPHVSPSNSCPSSIYIIYRISRPEPITKITLAQGEKQKI